MTRYGIRGITTCCMFERRLSSLVVFYERLGRCYSPAKACPVRCTNTCYSRPPIHILIVLCSYQTPGDLKFRAWRRYSTEQYSSTILIRVISVSSVSSPQLTTVVLAEALRAGGRTAATSTQSSAIQFKRSVLLCPFSCTMVSTNGPRIPSKSTGRASKVGTLRTTWADPDSKILLAGVSSHERGDNATVIFFLFLLPVVHPGLLAKL